MRHRIYLLFLLLCPGLTTWAQQIVDVHQQGDKIVVEYDLNQPAEFVRLYVSTDGGQNYRGPLKQVEGDVSNVSAGYNHAITWDVLKEFKELDGNDIKFKLSIKLKEKYYKETFFTVNGAYSPSPQFSFGFSVGQVKHFGWFVSFMTNGSFTGMRANGSCDQNGYLEGGYLPMYNGETSTDRLSVIGGGMMRLSGPLCARLGIGYGMRNLNWQTIDQKWFINNGYSVKGVDLSAGLQLNLGGFALSLEAVTTNFQTIEGKLGLGFVLRR